MSTAPVPPSWFQVPTGTVPAGYGWLIARWGLQVPPRPHLSFVAQVQSRKHVEVKNGLTRTTFPSSLGPGPTVPEQIEFALKYDGVDLEVWSALFALPNAEELGTELEDWVRRKPSSQYARRAWFLCELVSNVRLSLPDATGNYVPLLDPNEHYTGLPRQSRRHRVTDNLLGNARFCPTIRRTAELQALSDGHLEQEAAKVVAEYDADVLRRAVNYLYTKETRSSFKLEGEAPDARRAARFVEALSHTEDWQELGEATLTRLQNLIVLPGAEDAGYRKEEVYIGEQLDLTRQLIHYVAPRAVDLPELMDGLISCIERMASSDVPAIVQAAVAAFGLVFLHPFTDGNGRLHRLLIHRVLIRASFTPKGFILPVSAVILQNRAEYDAALESVSRALMPFVPFSEHEDGRIDIQGETARLYRYLDYTRIAEDLARWTESTIRTELKAELEFVSRYQTARAEIEKLADLSDRLLNLFIKIVASNKGRLSNAKRGLFESLSEAQIQQMEAAVRAAFDIP